MNEIIVSALYGIVPGMSIVVNRKDGKNGNVVGQGAVEVIDQIFVLSFFEIRVKDILTCVHLCVRSSAAIHGYFCFYNFLQDTFYHFLYAYDRRLPLPAMVVQSFECDMEKEALDGAKLQNYCPLPICPPDFYAESASFAFTHFSTSGVAAAVASGNANKKPTPVNSNKRKTVPFPIANPR